MKNLVIPGLTYVSHLASGATAATRHAAGAARHGSLRTPAAGSRQTSGQLVEAGGIEPPSAVAPGRASTSVACALISPGRPVRRRPTAGPALLWSHPSGEWLSFGASPFSDAGSLTTGRVRGDASPNYLGGECEILIRTYVVPVDLRGRPGTSACSSAGEPTTSKPGRPRMCVREKSSRATAT